MNISHVLRPAQKILTAGLVGAVAVTCLVATQSADTAVPQQGTHTVKPTKEWATKEWKGKSGATSGTDSTQATKEWKAKSGGATTSSTDSRDSTQATKEWKARSDGSAATVSGADRTLATKEWKVQPGTKEWATPLDLVAVTAYPAMGTSSYEKRVLARINAVRGRHGLRGLTVAACASTVANRWSAHLAATGTFTHQSMSGLLRRCHASYAGETLGRATVSPKTLVKMWMTSAPHRHILLSSIPRRIGVGATPNRRGEWVVTANFMRF